MQGERDFVGMGCAPGNDFLELHGIVSDGADLHQLSFDNLRGSHIELLAWHAGKGNQRTTAARENVCCGKDRRKIEPVPGSPESCGGSKLPFSWRLSTLTIVIPSDLLRGSTVCPMNPRIPTPSS